jgi:hypothetical protein
MTTTPPTFDDDLNRLVRSADPLGGGADHRAGDDAETLLGEILRTPREPHTPHRRRRTSVAVRLGALGGAAAIVVAAVAALTGGGRGAVAPASAAVVRHALAAVAQPAGSILHVDMRGKQWGAGTPTITWRDESWQETSAPHDRRQVETRTDGTIVESGNVGGAEQIYDPARNTIYVSSADANGDHAAAQREHAYRFRPGPTPDTSRLVLTFYLITKKGGKVVTVGQHRTLVVTNAQAAALKNGSDTIRWKSVPRAGHPKRPRYTATVVQAKAAEPAAAGCDDFGSEDYGHQIVTLLQSCGARLVGHAIVDGRDTLELRSRDGHITYYVDSHTYAPVQLDTTGTDGGTSLHFVTWELLAGGGANDALLSLTAQHPSATVDHDEADYRAAEQRMFPHG